MNKIFYVYKKEEKLHISSKIYVPGIVKVFVVFNVDKNVELDYTFTDEDLKSNFTFTGMYVAILRTLYPDSTVGEFYLTKWRCGEWVEKKIWKAPIRHRHDMTDSIKARLIDSSIELARLSTENKPIRQVVENNYITLSRMIRG